MCNEKQGTSVSDNHDDDDDDDIDAGDGDDIRNGQEPRDTQ
jgi:hypothetical protein